MRFYMLVQALDNLVPSQAGFGLLNLLFHRFRIVPLSFQIPISTFLEYKDNFNALSHTLFEILRLLCSQFKLQDSVSNCRHASIFRAFLCPMFVKKFLQMPQFLGALEVYLHCGNVMVIWTCPCVYLWGNPFVEDSHDHSSQNLSLLHC